VQGVIDGAEYNWPSYETGRHFEAAPYYSLTRHVMAPEILVMSLSRWDKLNDADKALVKKTAKASVPYMRNLWDERVSGARERLSVAGIEANEVSDLSAFQALMEPVWEQFILSQKQIDLVGQIKAIGDKLEAGS
jgi:TRAP-type C4-dicarboxylate transport system substrate-binding protein